MRPRLESLQAALVVSLFSATALAGEPERALKLWHGYRGAEETALERAVSKFTQETRVPVKLLPVPADAYASKLAAAIPHGAGPDVFILIHERLRQFAEQGLVLPSDGELDPTAYAENAVAALRAGDHRYGFPLSVKGLALFVNSSLVPETPATTEELLKLLPLLSRPEENRFGLAYESGDFYFHVPFFFGFGGELFDGGGRANFRSPGLARSLTFVKELQDRRFMPQEVSNALVKSLFNGGRAAMVVSGPWFTGEVSPDVPYAVVPLPFVNETRMPMRSFLGVEAAVVAAKTRFPKEAAALARFLSLEEAAFIRATVGRQVPANLAVYERPEVRDDPLINSFREAQENGIPMPNTLEMARVWEPMKLALRGVLQGEVTPEEAGALADRRYRALYRPAPESAPLWPYIAALAVLGALAAWSWWKRGRSPIPFARRYPDAARAFTYVAPAAAGLWVLVFIPFLFGFGLSVFHHESGHYRFVGLSNFVDILASRGYRMTEPLSFYFTLAVTLAWALVNVALHVGIGLGLALLLKDPLLRLRGVYRVLLIVPWAVPNYITALMWKGMFHRQFGAVNGLLAALHLEPISWFARFSTAFAANVATNTWLGFPFMMVVALGALQSIPQELYEAAEVDGAPKWAQFRRITLPLLRPALLPAVILGSIWTFNMFNVIYLVSGGEPGGSTDILVSEAFRWAFQRNEQYGFAAAYSVLIFCVLLAYSTLTKRLTQSEEERAA